MKKFFAIAALSLLVFVSMNSANTITMGDTVRVNPNKLDGYSRHAVTMTNDGYVDSWAMAVTYPDGLFPKLVSGVTPLDGMTIPYTDKHGEQQVYTCPMTVSAAYADISSTITAMGYWDYDYDNEYEPYGTVKWSAGSHAMYEYNLYVDPSFRNGYITMSGTMSSGYDQRGAVLQGVRFYSRTYVYVGYMKGDVNGDGRVSISDVTLLISHLMGAPMEELNEFQLDAAEFNLDGKISIVDVTAIIDSIMSKK